MSNAMSLKAKIRNIAKQKNIPAQVILQNYMFERLLVRLAASAFRIQRQVCVERRDAGGGYRGAG